MGGAWEATDAVLSYFASLSLDGGLSLGQGLGAGCEGLELHF